MSLSQTSQSDLPDAAAPALGLADLLPSFPPRHERERHALEASRALVGLYLREGTANISVKQLAEHAGLSERTFYRTFPTKEDTIRPYVEAGLHHVVAQVREAPAHRPLREVLISAHAELLDAASAHGGGVFLELLRQNEPLRAVWLKVVTDAEGAFAEVIAARLGISPGSVQARLAGAAVVTAGRLALEPLSPGQRGSEVFEACLDLLGPALFEPRPS
jgi:AcrR family transcriptional regulator